MYTRRDFIKLCAKTTLTASLAEILLFDLCQAVEAKEIRKPTIVWLELGSCTGDTISLENSSTPSVRELFSNVVNLKYHWVLMNVNGEHSLAILQDIEHDETGEFILVVEGSVCLADQGHWDYAAYQNNQLITGLELLKRLAPKAKHIIAIGSCAAFGGPAAAHPNPSKSVGVQDVVREQVINTSGCPCHPDWFIGTLYHLINYGVPELDTHNRPKIFYGRTIHDQCQRRTYYEKGIFAKNLGEPWCMFTVGCRGPRTFADCPIREWNEANNWPVGCSTPCIGCVEPGFPDVSSPFFQRYPDLKLPGFTANFDKAALTFGLISLAGIGTHLIVNLSSRRLRKNLSESSLPMHPVPPQDLTQVPKIKPQQTFDLEQSILPERTTQPKHLAQTDGTNMRRPKKVRRTLIKP